MKRRLTRWKIAGRQAERRRLIRVKGLYAVGTPSDRRRTIGPIESSLLHFLTYWRMRKQS